MSPPSTVPLPLACWADCRHWTGGAVAFLAGLVYNDSALPVAVVCTSVVVLAM